MTVVLYCKTKAAFLRLEKALQRQGGKLYQEKQTIPVTQWIFVAEKAPELKNTADIDQEFYELFYRPEAHGEVWNFDKFKKEKEFDDLYKLIDWVEGYDPNKPENWQEEEMYTTGGQDYYWKSKRVPLARIKSDKNIDKIKPGRKPERG